MDSWPWAWLDDETGTISANKSPCIRKSTKVMLIPKGAKVLEDPVIWAALLVIGRGVSWKNVKARQLIGAVDDTQISLENITLSNGAQVLALLKERESLLAERSQVTRNKATNLITLSSTILSGLLALVGVKLMTGGWLLCPIIPLAVCTLLLISHVGIDEWRALVIEDRDLSVMSCRLSWIRHEIHDRDEAWKHNEEVSRFLTTVYGAARTWFTLGMLALPIPMMNSSSAPPTSDAPAREMESTTILGVSPPNEARGPSTRSAAPAALRDRRFVAAFAGPLVLVVPAATGAAAEDP